tara:strand:+ start:29 stop:994 length:966 start_codon:yes stop_codon:yes gene_type:complete
MKKLFLFFTLAYTSFFVAQETQIIKYPCSLIADNYKINKGLSKWPKFKKGQTLKINSFINYQYPTEDSKLNSEWFEQRRPWWTKIENDPWSEYPFFGEKFIPPKLDFKKNVDDNLRWKCGYSYMIDIPVNFKNNKTYPLVIFLHGGIDTDQKKFLWYERQRKSFYMSEDDPYIIAAPIKLGWDWDPKKVIDIIEDIKKNLKIDPNRIYLTGLSMGGRGTFIVASQYPKVFASILALSPHHTPYSYIELIDKVKDIPILISHGDSDRVSSFFIAEKMYKGLKDVSAQVTFKPRLGIGHWGWESFYSNSENINWLLSWRKKLE